jgi:hypothetical protein
VDVGIIESTFVVNGNADVHDGNATVSEIGATRENATGNTMGSLRLGIPRDVKCQMNAAGRLVADPAGRLNVADGEFFWFIKTTETYGQRMRPIQPEFRGSNRYCQLVSAYLADDIPPVVLHETYISMQFAHPKKTSVHRARRASMFIFPCIVERQRGASQTY